MDTPISLETRKLSFKWWDEGEGEGVQHEEEGSFVASASSDSESKKELQKQIMYLLIKSYIKV